MTRPIFKYFLFLIVIMSPVVGVPKGSLFDVPKKKEKDLTPQEAAIFYANVAARIQKEYVHDVSQSQLLGGALNGMLTSLDPHSGYLSPEKFEMIKDSVKGEYEGLGMEVLPKNGLILIVSPMDDTPAERAGLKPGDYIIMVDGKPVLNEDLNDIVKKMQGKPGTKITLTIRRESKPPFDVTLSRAIIKVKAVKWKVFKDVGYIRITSFINKSTKNEVMDAIQSIQQKVGNKLKGYIIDLRNNAGGLLDQAVDVTDIFIKAGEVVSIRGRDPKDTQAFKTGDDEDFTKGLPLVVLINDGSASASEIMAGALQDHGRAVVVGTRSFGKGSVQVIMPLTNGGAIKMTTALYYTPSGRSIQKDGVEPDIYIPQSVDVKEVNSRVIREKDLSNALENGNVDSSDKEKEKDKDDSEAQEDNKDFFSIDEKDKDKDSDSEQHEKDKLLVSDFQLKRAVDIVKGMSIYAHSIVGKRKKTTSLAKNS